MRQRSLKNDKADDSSFRHPYGRNNDMKMDSEFGQHIPFFFTREGSFIDIVGQYKGRSAFLICNGPSFIKLNRNLLNEPGVITFGINNGPKTFRPNFWNCVDDPVRFMKSIWLDPKITKFIPQAHFEKPIFDNEKWEILKTKVGDCPNVIGYRRNEKFHAERFLVEETLCWGNHKDFGGGRSVMLPSLRILHLLGFRKVYLLGCDMKMATNYAYHFDEQRSAGAVNCNNSTYDRLKSEYLPSLKPIFDKAGFQVFNCNPESELKVFPFVNFEDAIKEATSELGDVKNERVWGMYSTPDEKSKWKQEPTKELKPHLQTLEMLANGMPINLSPTPVKQVKAPKVNNNIPPMPPVQKPIPQAPANIIRSFANNPHAAIPKFAECVGGTMARTNPPVVNDDPLPDIEVEREDECEERCNIIENIPSAPSARIIPQVVQNNIPQTVRSPIAPPTPIRWNPFNKVVQDHRNGTIDLSLTNQERAKRGLRTPWTPAIGEKEVMEPAIE
jgi:hypothetical protein